MHHHWNRRRGCGTVTTSPLGSRRRTPMHITRSRRALGALTGAAVAATTLLLATPVSAGPPPVTAPLVDEAGNLSGCEITAATPYARKEAGRWQVWSEV